MKTLKNTESQKIVTWSLVVMFSFLQIVPTGWAATGPVEELRAQSVSGSEKAISQEKVEPSAPATPVFVTTQDFWVNQSPLSAATPDVTQAAVGEGGQPDSESNRIEPFASSQGSSYQISSTGAAPVSASPAGSNTLSDPASQSTATQSTVQSGISAQISGSDLNPLQTPAANSQTAFASEDHGGITVTTTTMVTEGEVTEDAKTSEPTKIPEAVQAVVDALQKQMGAGFKVTATLLEDGTYQFTVVDAKNYIQAPTSGLKNLRFFGRQEIIGETNSIPPHLIYGSLRIDVHSVEAIYYGSKGDVKVDAQLLWGAMTQLVYRDGLIPALPPPGSEWMIPVQYLTMMTQLAVTAVDKDGAIHFVKDRQLWKVYRNEKGEVILEEEAIVENKLPLAVKQYVGELQRQIGNGFEVEATLQSDGTYLIGVTDNKDYVQGPTTGLRGLLFILDKDGMLKDGSVQAFYYGQAKVDGNLIFGAALQLADPCFGAEVCAMLYLTPQQMAQRAVIALTQIKVNSVDAAGTIHFVKDGQLWKVSRGETGQIKLEKELPPLVQAYVDALKGQLGAGFQVTANLQKDGNYLVRVSMLSTCKEGAVACATMMVKGTFLSLEFSLSADGAFNRDSVKAGFAGVEVDGKFLFDAMSVLEASFHPAGTEWMVAPPHYTARLVTLASQILVKESQRDLLKFNHNGKPYTVSRDANGRVILEKELPPAVQQFVDHLETLIPWWKVSATLVFDGKSSRYQITVSIPDGSIHGIPALIPQGGFKGMSFVISTNGVMDDASVLAIFEGIKVDSQLLLGGIERIYPPIQLAPCIGDVCVQKGPFANWEALRAMTKIMVNNVDASGAIHFSLDGKNYKVFRDSNRQVKLEQEISPRVREYVEVLQKQLGTGFKVTATVQTDGTYLISVSDVKNYIATPLVGLRGLLFLLNKDGNIKDGSVQAFYYGQAKPDGNLLFGAAMRLADPCLKGQVCTQQALIPQQMAQRAITLMTQIKVNNVDASAAIYFELKGKHYKTFRDRKTGRVVLEEVLIALPHTILYKKPVALFSPVILKSKMKTSANAAVSEMLAPAAILSCKILTTVPATGKTQKATARSLSNLKAPENPKSLLLNAQQDASKLTSTAFGSESGSVISSRLLRELTK